MISTNSKRAYINLSHGDPLFPFTELFRTASRNSQSNLTQYNPNTYLGENFSGRYRHALLPIHNYINDRGLKRCDWTGVGLDSLLMIDGGTTRGFEMVMRCLISDVVERNRHIHDMNESNNDNIAPIRPAILMPVPTYGHFIWVLNQNPELGKQVEIIPINRDPLNDWCVDTNHMIETIKKSIADDKRIIAYFDSNPNNPTGHVRDREETKRIGDVISDLNEFYMCQDSTVDKENISETKPKDTEESFLSSLFAARSKMFWNGPSANVHIIDDMVYDGLQYDSSQSHCTFSEVMDKYKYCITLMGTSKNGLASMRAGLIIATSNIMNDLRNMDRNSNYVASDMTLNILSLFFNNSAEREQKRLAYQKKAITHYRFAGQFVKALINGIDSVLTDLSKSDAKRMHDILRATQNLTAEEARTVLKSGIKGIKISTNPQAGFFHLLDFSGLKGMGFSVEKNWGATYRVLESEHDFTDLCNKMGLSLASGSYMGTPKDICSQRLTYALPLPEIIRATERLKLIVRTCKP